MRFGFALFLGGALATGLPLAAQTSAPAGQTGARVMLRPTNLQVLPKNTSGREVMETMREFSKALGVECDFCHSEDPQTHRPNFALDANPDKDIARTMMRMTAEINSKYVSTINDPDASAAQKTVTCGTCHRGHSMPMPFNAAPGQMEHHSMPAKP